MFMVRVIKDGKTIECRKSSDFCYVNWFVGIRVEEGCECTVYEEREEAWKIIHI